MARGIDIDDSNFFGDNFPMARPLGPVYVDSIESALPQFLTQRLQLLNYEKNELSFKKTDNFRIICVRCVRTGGGGIHLINLFYRPSIVHLPPITLVFALINDNRSKWGDLVGASTNR